MILYKYKSLLGDGLAHALDIIVNGRVYVSTRDKMNDPEEGHYGIPVDQGGFDGFTQDGVKRIMEQIDAVRFTCFTKECTNPLLWAHYAGGFSGVALEFDLDESIYELREVTYTGNATVSPSDLRDVLEGTRSVVDIGCLIHKQWVFKYEDEVRIFARRDQSADYVNAKPISLVLGIRESLHVTVLRKIARKYGLKVGYLVPSEVSGMYEIEFPQLLENGQ